MTEDKKNPYLVVVGSSAGGIEALSRLVSTIPEGFSAPVVIAQHLDPERKSRLQEILARCSNLPVRTVTERDTLEPGVVYVIPADRHVNVTDHEIDLMVDTHGRPKPSVDLLMKSSAERRRAEAERDRALFQQREARKQVSGVLESINDAFFAVDRDWRLTYVNRRTEEFWRRSRDGLLGKSLWEEFPETVGTEVERSLRRAMEGGETVGFETLSPVSKVWISARAYPSADGLSVYFQDISERKEAEEALRRNEARWRALIDKGADVITISARDGTVTFASPSIETVCGYGVEEFVGKSPFEVGHIHPDDLEHCEAAFGDLADKPGHSLVIEHRYRHGSGEWRWLEGTFTNLFDDEAIGGLVANFRDVTERKRAEEDARRAAELDAFRVELNDALRPLTDPVGIQAEAARVLGGRLRADGAHYTQVDEGRGLYRIERDFVRGDVPSMVGDYPMSAFSWLGPTFLEGGRIVVSDARTSPLIPEAERAAVAAINVAALVSVPLVKGGRLVAAFSAVSVSPREWTPEEVELINETAEHTWAAVERARVERALHESEERFRAVANLVPDLLWSNDSRGVTDWYNERWPEYTGRSLEGDLGHGWLDVIHPDDRDRSRADFRRAVGAGEPLRQEHRIRAADGSYRWFLVRAEPVQDAGGRIVRWYGTATDVHEHRTALEALRENEEWLSLAQRGGRSGTWEWDLLTGEIRWSAGHRDLFGFDPSDEPVERADWWAAIHPEDLPRIEEAGRRCSEGGGEWPETEYRIFRDGELRWISARGQTERDHGGRAVRIRGISVDATERKRAEEERDRLLAREWVAAAEAAERERISRELHDRVAHSLGVAHQSLQLYEVLVDKNPEKAALKLDLAKATTKASLESTRNLSAELRQLEAEEGLEAELGHLLDVAVPPRIGASLRVEGDEDAVPGHVRGQLFLILREAVRNAVAHSGCASVSVALEVEDGKVVGRVEDDGAGFDANDGHGGVGLRSMRERAALLDGALDLNCEPGRGTRVSVSVPLKGER